MQKTLPLNNIRQKLILVCHERYACYYGRFVNNGSYIMNIFQFIHCESIHSIYYTKRVQVIMELFQHVIVQVVTSLCFVVSFMFFFPSKLINISEEIELHIPSF